MPSIRISRQFINAEVYGEGRRTAVFLHGLGPGALAWRQVAEGVPASHRALAIDLPGFGESERGSFQGAVDEAATIVHHTLHGHGDLSPVDLVGHDYGGLVALDFAARYPSHVRRLAAGGRRRIRARREGAGRVVGGRDGERLGRRARGKLATVAADRRVGQRAFRGPAGRRRPGGARSHAQLSAQPDARAVSGCAHRSGRSPRSRARRLRLLGNRGRIWQSLRRGPATRRSKRFPTWGIGRTSKPPPKFLP